MNKLFKISLFVIVLATSCKPKILNEIPEKCYNEIYARVWVNGVEQSIPDGTNDLTGINDNYLFGISPLGSWDMSIETDSFFIGFSSQHRLISESEYQSSSHNDWKQMIAERGNYSIKAQPMMSRTYFVSFNSNTTWIQEPQEEYLREGNVSLSTSQNGDCYFLKLEFWARIEDDNGTTYLIEGEIFDTYGPLNK